MNLNVLQYVIAVYEEKNITKAAQKLFIAQPTLSQSIRLLEEELGSYLFDRAKTPIETTEAGELFIQWAKQVLSSEQSLKNQMSIISEKAHRTLTIGISPNKTNQLLPEALKSFYALTSGCSVKLREDTSKELNFMLERDTVDLLIGQPCSNTIQFESIPLTNERILLAAPESYRMTVSHNGDYPSINISELADKPFILQSGNEQFVDMLYNLYKRIGKTPTIVLECQSPQTAHTMVSYNIGMTFISEVRLMNSRLPNVCYYILDDIPLRRIVAVTYRKDRPLSQDASTFISIVQNECPKFV